MFDRVPLILMLKLNKIQLKCLHLQEPKLKLKDTFKRKKTSLKVEFPQSASGYF